MVIGCINVTTKILWSLEGGELALSAIKRWLDLVLEQMPGSELSSASANAASVISETEEASYKEEWEMRESHISCKADDDLCPDNLCMQ